MAAIVAAVVGRAHSQQQLRFAEIRIQRDHFFQQLADALVSRSRIALEQRVFEQDGRVFVVELDGFFEIPAGIAGTILGHGEHSQPGLRRGRIGMFPRGLLEQAASLFGQPSAQSDVAA